MCVYIYMYMSVYIYTNTNTSQGVNHALSVLVQAGELYPSHVQTSSNLCTLELVLGNRLPIYNLYTL